MHSLTTTFVFPVIDSRRPSAYNSFDFRALVRKFNLPEGELRRIPTILVVLLVLPLSLSLALPVFAQDGAATYKAKCAACHGPEGQGKVGPALKGTSLTADQITH